MEQILALYKSTENRLNSTIVIDLIKKATSHKSIFGFAEFYEPLRAKQLQIQLEQKQEPSNEKQGLNSLACQWIDILQVFTYGTWDDYKVLRDDSMSDTFPELNETQTTKLRQLTVVTMASETESLMYDLIKEKLQLSSDEEVERLIIDTVYADLLDARLDTRNKIVEVLQVAGRDASPERLDEISKILTEWDQLALSLLRKTQETIGKSKEHVRNTGNKTEKTSLKPETKKVIT